MPDPDHQLLDKFIRSRHQEAFAQLVARHGGMVFAAALRQVGRRELAAEVGQSVFILLAKKAPRLGPQVVLGAWLHRATHLECLHVLRGEARRAKREAAAATESISDRNTEHTTPFADNAPSWDELRPVLDAGLDHLSTTDRQALFLRYFQGLNHREIASQIETTEEAAKKRVGRALERLRSWMEKRGVRSSATAFSLVLSQHASAQPLEAATAQAWASQATSLATSGTSFFYPLLTAMSSAKFTTLAAAVAFTFPVGHEVLTQHRPGRTQISAPGSLDKTSIPSPENQPQPQAQATVGATSSMDPRLAKIAEGLPKLEGEARTETLLALIPLVQALPKDQFEPAWRLFQRFQAKDLIEVLFYRWAEVDEDEAWRRAREKGDEGEPSYAVGGVVDFLALRNPSKALELISGIPRGLFRTVMELRVYRTLGLTDPKSALQLAKSTGIEQAAATKELLTYWAEKNPAEALAWIAAEVPEKEQRDLEKEILDDLTFERPDLAVVAAQTLANKDRRESATLFAIQCLAQTQPDAAHAFLKSATGLDSDFSMNAAFNLGQSGPQLLEDLALNLPMSDYRDGFLGVYERKIDADAEPERLLTLTMMQSNTESRHTLIGFRFPNWLRRDPEKARAWLESADLPTDLKSKLAISR